MHENVPAIRELAAAFGTLHEYELVHPGRRDSVADKILHEMERLLDGMRWKACSAE